MTDRHQPSAAAARRARQIGGGARPRPPAAGNTTGAADPADTVAPETVAPETDGQASAEADVEVDTGTGKAARARPDLVKRRAARPRNRVDGASRTGATDAVDVDPGHADPVDAGPEDPEATSGTGSSDLDEAAARTGGRRRVLTVVGFGLAALLLAWGVLLAVVLFGHVCVGPLQGCTVRGTGPTDRAVAAAKTDVALLTSYSYQSIDSDAQKTSAVLTGEFKSQYDKSISDVVKPQLPTTQTVSAGQVSTAGVESANRAGDEVVVVVYGQQAVTNKAQTTPRIDPFQLRVTMSLIGDRWLISAVVQLGNQS